MLTGRHVPTLTEEVEEHAADHDVEDDILPAESSRGQRRTKRKKWGSGTAVGQAGRMTTGSVRTKSSVRLATGNNIQEMGMSYIKHRNVCFVRVHGNGCLHRSTRAAVQEVLN